LQSAYLRGAYLRGANLESADIHGADLRGANDVLRLDMTDPREYWPIAVAWADGWRIASGCQWFTVPEALAHWGSTDYIGDKTIAARYLRAISTLPVCPVL
jgi:hypothetical protein